ncbi:ATP-dependent zinc metalloprotease FtsH [Dyella lutea]|uniref:ATP-dependent zinc metalloprotease FtsH n=1 Tax=Dyella lutea TaxID=2950441 RepID=A0ABT1FGM2_9GAMM|nr:ATP-dependent zinc metalloprotease FtsH [Dyella lutea]MCP1375273.1 ATP-dependent zinc metalloprotease FtsH [Dyella lutea]
MKRDRPINAWYFVAALLTVVALQFLFAGSAVETVPYSRFQAELKAGDIAEVTVSGDSIRGSYRQPAADGRPRRFQTTRVAPELAKALSDAGITYSGKASPGWGERMLTWLLPPLLFVGMWLLLMQRMPGSGRSSALSIGKSKVKIYLEKSIATTFDDVAGVDEAKEELREVIAFLKDPVGYGRLGAHVPKGVLLVGPPGTGKTLLARAVAGEAGVPFLSISGSEFVELFVGVGAARVRDLFSQAGEHAPCIIFIDELDALGRARGAAPVSGGQDEKEQTLNQLLTELDGFDVHSGVVLLAATNRPEILDPALLRAGRFDRQILVDRPDRPGRLAILRVHARKLKLDADVSLDDVAALTAGMTGADLANLLNEATLLATRRGAGAVEPADLTGAIERVVAGLEKKTRVLSPRERRTVAYHETGHALVAMALPGSDPVQKVSIIPRGISGLGYTLQRPTEDRFLMSRDELADRMTVLLGGRAAEMLALGDMSTGAADDLARATGIARGMVTHYGMAPELGQITYEEEAGPLLGYPLDAWQPRRYSEASAAAIDRAVRELVEQAFMRARAILVRDRDALERVAEALLARETLSGAELATMAAPPVAPTGSEDVGHPPLAARG